jgi:hypothetical protein
MSGRWWPASAARSVLISEIRRHWAAPGDAEFPTQDTSAVGPAGSAIGGILSDAEKLYDSGHVV